MLRAGDGAGWLMAAAMFTYMAVDDGHTSTSGLGHSRRSSAKTAGRPCLICFRAMRGRFLFVPLFGLFGLLLLVFVWYELRDRTGLLLVVAAIACLVVAVGLDFIEGLDADHPWNVYSWITSRVDLADFTAARFRHSPYSTLKHFSRSLEESLEMLAMTFLWVAFLRHIPSVARTVHVRLTT